MVFYEDEVKDDSAPEFPQQEDGHPKSEPHADGSDGGSAKKDDLRKVDEYDSEDTAENYIERNKALFADKSLMKPNWLHFDYPIDMVWMICCGCFTMGGNWSLASREDDELEPVKFFGGCCCGSLLCGCIRNRIQTSIGVEPEGVGWGCLMHLCICCSPCSMVQEHRGILRWKSVTSSKFKSKWQNSNRYAWDVAMYAFNGQMTSTNKDKSPK